VVDPWIRLHSSSFESRPDDERLCQDLGAKTEQGAVGRLSRELQEHSGTPPFISDQANLQHCYECHTLQEGLLRSTEWRGHRSRDHQTGAGEVGDCIREEGEHPEDIPGEQGCEMVDTFAALYQEMGRVARC